MSFPELALPAFVAGLFTFLAPCTLPLVPGYLGFISGVSLSDWQDSTKAKQARRRIFLNGVLYVIGFSTVFVLLGSLVGLGGQSLIAYRSALARIGGILVMLFGLFMITGGRIPFLQALSIERHIPLVRSLKPGTPGSSFLFGATFALGWTPCLGPILGSILILAATSTMVGEGALLLAIFSLGMALPFLLIAAVAGRANTYITNLSSVLAVISFVGGVFLIFLGVLLFTNNFAFFTTWFYEVFSFLRLEERLLKYL